MSELNEQVTEHADEQTESLEERVKRLEDALASMQDTRIMEDRIFERLSSKIKNDKPPEPPKPPKPSTPPPPVEDKVADTVSRSFGNAGSTIQKHAESYIAKASGVSPEVVKQSWLVLDIWKEFRTILSMFFDVRYKMSWVVRWTVVVLFALILTSGLWPPLAGVPVLGPIISSLVSLILAFIMTKILIREADRYRASR